jgi:phage terminase large subunit
MFEYDDINGAIGNIKFIDDPQGFIKIYIAPVTGYPYVIGGDTAGEGSDSFVGQVIDNTSGVQVATLRHTFDEDLYARQMYCLGMHYNTALIGIESNYSTYPVMALERLRYPRQYVRETIDDFTHAVRKSFGFQTNTKTRPVAISTFIKAVREDVNIVSDSTTLEEMLTFTRDENYKPTAEEGAHDDCVMALSIAHYIRPQMRYTVDLPEAKKVKWTDDMWEDYRGSSADIQKYLIEKWGSPK